MITQCAEVCPFKTASGWCGLSACIRRNTTTDISPNAVTVIPEGYVKVVRCKDCKYWHMGLCCRNDIYTGKNHYCACGERRDDDGSTD